MRSLQFLGSLDPNLAALVIFAVLVLVVLSLVMVYYVTIDKTPILLSNFLEVIGKAIDAVVIFFKRML